MSLDTVDGLFSRIQLNLGRGAQTTIAAMIPEWANLIQREVSRRGKWWFAFVETSALSLAVSGDSITLPTDFVDEEYVFLKDSAGNITEVQMMEDMEYRKAYTDLTGSGYESLPRHYLLQTGTMLFRPISNAAYTVLLGYWSRFADLVAGGAINNLLKNYPEVLEYGATDKGFQYMQEYEDAQYWNGKYEAEIRKMTMANNERQFPGEMILSIRSGQRSNRISRRVHPARSYY